MFKMEEIQWFPAFPAFPVCRPGPKNPNDLDSTESLRIHWNPQESSETPQKFLGIPRNPQES